MLNCKNIKNSNIIMSNVSTGNGIIITNNKIIINGKEYKIPGHIKGNNQTIINNKIYINGYEFKDGEFKRTLKALWYKWF